MLGQEWETLDPVEALGAALQELSGAEHELVLIRRLMLRASANIRVSNRLRSVVEETLRAAEMVSLELALAGGQDLFLGRSRLKQQHAELAALIGAAKRAQFN